ncbi:MAG: NifU family protein [Acidimicrobiales bacterium]
MSGGIPEVQDPVLSVTSRALETVLALRSEEEDADRLALWLEVNGVAQGAYTYDLYFEAVGDAGPDDALCPAEGLTVVVPAASVEQLRGATLDVSDGDGGMVLLNPNTPPGPPTGDLTGPVAQQVLEVLESQINPAIAGHGGRADLVAVDEGTAYLRLSGGCQGCGLAAVTLSQGIEVAIKDSVPEIVSVVDVTDHAGGQNPYFEPAKK